MFIQSHEWRNLANSGAYFAGLLRPGMTVLDVGSGPGALTFDIAARVAPGAVIVVDRSADIMAHALEAAARRGATGVSFGHEQRLSCKESIAKDQLQRSTCKEVFAWLLWSHVHR